MRLSRYFTLAAALVLTMVVLRAGELLLANGSACFRAPDASEDTVVADSASRQGGSGWQPPLPLPEDALDLGHANAAVVWDAVRKSCARHYNETEFASRAPLNMSVSVVIGAWNRPLTLRVIVAALRRQRLVAGVEIVIMDAGSSPPLSQLLPGLDVDQLHYWKEDGRHHRVRSFNAGVAAASHNIVLLLDDDVIPASDYWAYAAVAALSSAPGASIMRMPIVMKEMKHDLSDAKARQAEFESLVWDQVFHLMTFNIAVRREAWEVLGGLNPLFDGVYGDEDTDFHQRAERKGMQYGMSHMTGASVHVGVYWGNRNTGKKRRNG